MKTNSIILRLALGVSLAVFSGCQKAPKDVETPQKDQSEATAANQDSAESFTSFSTLDFSYIDESGEEQKITLHRNDLIIDLMKSINDIPKKDLSSVDIESCEKLSNALELLYGKNVDQNVSKAVSLLHELADVKKPYDQEHWKVYEIQCHSIAKYILSLCFQDGVGVSKNPDKGLALLKEACFYDMLQWDRDNMPAGWENDLDDVVSPVANFELSVRFLSGNGLNPNFAKGMYLLDAAQDRGVAEANGIQMKIMPIVKKLPERFQNRTPSFRLFEGFSVLDITKMLAREREKEASK